jgi:hypothetical protein
LDDYCGLYLHQYHLVTLSTDPSLVTKSALICVLSFAARTWWWLAEAKVGRWSWREGSSSRRVYPGVARGLKQLSPDYPDVFHVNYESD